MGLETDSISRPHPTPNIDIFSIYIYIYIRFLAVLKKEISYFIDCHPNIYIIDYVLNFNFKF